MTTVAWVVIDMLIGLNAATAWAWSVSTDPGASNSTILGAGAKGFGATVLLGIAILTAFGVLRP